MNVTTMMPSAAARIHRFIVSLPLPSRVMVQNASSKRRVNWLDAGKNVAFSAIQAAREKPRVRSRDFSGKKRLCRLHGIHSFRFE
jgi:hypothetical protein